ncbi:MAG: restriction endonuclease subunit S [Bacillota bacterium]
MSDKIIRLPEIRFAGFTDGWEQHRLGDIVQITMGQSPDSINYTDNPDDHILVQGNADMKNGRVVPRVWTTQVTKQAEKNDLILSVRAPVGDVGKTDYNVVLGRGVASIKGNDFIFQSLGRMKQNGYWTKLSTGSTFESINSNDIRGAYIMIPNKEEQKKIGDFFSNLDNLIILHQRELELLKEMKKSLLQKMFPKDGANVPEIRFAGFTDPWEQRKLGEVFEQTSEYVNPKVENLELWSLTVENGLTQKTERYNREFLVKKEGQFKSVSDNEFIYNPMNMTLGAVDLNLTGKKVAVSGYYITMKTTENYDSKYFGIWLKTPLAIKMYKIFATGSLIERQRVQFPTLSQITASVPSKDEQAKIGNFFKQLDDTITLHQRELNSLDNLKKSLLQQLFI